MTDLPSKLTAFKMGEAAFLTQIGRDTIAEACERGELRHYRSGVGRFAHRMILRESLICWMNSCGIPLDVSLRGKPRKTGRGSGAPEDWYACKRENGVKAAVTFGGVPNPFLERLAEYRSKSPFRFEDC